MRSSVLGVYSRMLYTYLPGSVKVTVPKLKLIGLPAAVPSAAVTSI